MNNLLRLVGRRIVALPFMAFGVTLLVFFLMSFSQYDPAVAALGENASQASLDAYNHEMGFDLPWYQQFFNYLGGLFHGDLGVYGVNRDSVGARIGEAFPVTLQLTFIGLFAGLIFAVIFGVLAALYRDKWVDQVIRVISIVFIATPSFWLGVLMIYLFQIRLAWLPASGDLVPFFTDPNAYVLRMAMPCIAMALPLAGSMTRIIRTSMVEELDKDYVRTAIGAGIPKGVVIARNVFRNALITPITVLGMKIGYMMGGAIVVEVIFALPGMGTVLFDGINNNQPTLVQGVVLVVALAFIIINIIVDMLYVLINPRIRTV